MTLVVRVIDAASALADTPDAIVFNGVANQYDARPLTARVDDRVHLWVLAAGPNRGTSFHVVGGQFDTVWTEGRYTLGTAAAPAPGRRGGAQVLPLLPAQGGFVELTLLEAGHYSFVTHVMADAEHEVQAERAFLIDYPQQEPAQVGNLLLGMRAQSLIDQRIAADLMGEWTRRGAPARVGSR